MAGSLAVYQGWVCSSAKLVRTRGFQASLGQVEFVVKDYPDSFRFDPSTNPEPLDVGAYLPRLSVGRTTGSDGDQLPQPGVLRAAGYLLIMEADQLGNQFTLPPILTYVVKIESVRRSNRGELSRVRVTFADARYRWDRGGMDRWSWNRLRADGTMALDSLRQDGKPYSREDIAKQIVGALHGGPDVSRVPAAWKSSGKVIGIPRLDPFDIFGGGGQPAGGGLDFGGSAKGGSAGPFQLPPYPAAVEALGKLTTDQRVEAPCLDWDGRVSLWEPGEGRLGYASNGVGSNSQDFPPDHVLDKRGAGKGHDIEPQHPPETVIVVAGERVASVSLDRWEPVLYVQNLPKAEPSPLAPSPAEATPGGTGFVLPLNDETVRKITGGRYGIEWLKVWILGPRTYKDVPGLTQQLAQLLTDQAWRLYRMPGVIQDVDGTEEPGPNAHLLPILDRAETSGGRRLPPLVEIYTYAPINWELAGDSVEADAVRQARKALAFVKSQIHLAAQQQGKRDPFNDSELRFDAAGLFEGHIVTRSAQDALIFNPAEWIGAICGAGPDLFSPEEVSAAVAQAQTVERIGRMLDEGFASQYANAIGKLYAAEGRGREVLFQLGQEAMALERKLQADKSGVISGAKSVQTQLLDEPGLLISFKQSASEKLQAVRAVRRRREDELRLSTDPASGQTRTNPGEPPPPRPRTVVTHRNLPRAPDSGAVVFNPGLGLIRTAQRAVHLYDPGVPFAHATFAIPKAVRVTFGAVLRPKLSRPVTQAAQTDASGAAPDYAPEILGDEESYYATWWQRQAAGGTVFRVDPQSLAEDARKALRQSAVTLHHPEIGGELIPLPPSEGNRKELDLAAEEIARQALLRPDKVESDRYVLARPWPVQCDGIVSGVEITSRTAKGGGLSGFETTIHTGSSAPRLDPGGTRTRPPKLKGQADASKREGTP